jgi:ubiquinone/menaquinone biosynthesis C-methylase UbiE/uncharacterized protein YbaR (Trm112 family)
MEWINILKCPVTGNDLRIVSASEIEQINGKIRNGIIYQADGKILDTEIREAIIDTSNVFIYPIAKGVVLLLPDLLLTEYQDKLQFTGLTEDKKLVKNFYDNRGWHTTESGDYEDADIFEDLRPFAQDYLTKCHRRVSRYLNKSGNYLLDAASGALQFPEYLEYSRDYKYRICVDLSFQGLLECKRKLKDKAICLLCDMTNLPIKDNLVDGFVSLNTIYHIPKDEQVKAIVELYRVLKPEGKGVIVYDWYKHSMWMNITLLPFRGFEFLKHRTRGLIYKAAGKDKPQKMLYFYAHNYSYFLEKLPIKFKLVCWRSVSVPFMKVYLHTWLLGKKMLERIYEYEEKNPELCGLKGEYPMFVFEKKS